MDSKKIQDEDRESMFGSVFGVSGPGRCVGDSDQENLDNSGNSKTMRENNNKSSNPI